MNAHTFWAYAIASLNIIGAMATIWLIGQKRDTITPGTALVTAVINVTLALGLLLTL